MNHLNEIVIGVTGVVASIVAWRFGGKQKTENETNDTLTSGTAKIVDTSNALLDRLQQLLEQERERAADERVHRQNCEQSLNEHKLMILELTKKVKNLESEIKKK